MTFLIKPDIQEQTISKSEPTYVSFKIDDKPPSWIIRKPLEKIKPLERPKSERAIITRVQPSKKSLISEKGLQVSMSDFKVAMTSNAGVNPWGSSTGVSSGLQPVIRINPTYPVHAARNDIEGFVILSFDISEIGKPINIQIIDAKPRGYFEKSARRAIKKWKYDLESVKNRIGSQQVTLAFKLEDEA